MKWEYADIAELHQPGHEFIARLNEMGAQGWEAVGVSIMSGHLHALLKRPLDGGFTPTEPAGAS
jgi:hypothetical protein